MGLRGLWGFWKRRVTLSQLAAVVMGFAMEWSKRGYKDILEFAGPHIASSPENTKLRLQQELCLVAASTARTACEAEITKALGRGGVQAFEAALPVAARAFLKEGAPEGVIRALLAQLEAAHAEYRGVILAPDLADMTDLYRRLYTVFSERVFGKVVEDLWLSHAFHVDYVAGGNAFEDVLKRLRIIRG